MKLLIAFGTNLPRLLKKLVCVVTRTDTNDKLGRYEEDNLKEIYNFLSTRGFVRKY